MIKELLLANGIVLGLIILTALVKRTTGQRVNPQLAELKEVFGDDVEIHKIPKMEDDEELTSDAGFVSSKTSKKYHKADCVSAKNIKTKISKSAKEFKTEGKTPCSTCIKA